MTLAAGDRLGRYEIVGMLGKGGMGEVYRALDRTLEREVAVKVLPETVAADRERLERFEREAKAVARLAHPNILEIWDFGTDREIAYAVTELLEGGTLREELAGGPLPWSKVREIAAAVADGLAAAHAKGIVHRDLKPENIFITADGRVKILDFGLARLAGPISSEAATGTLTPADTQRGVVLGTLGYISPEQLKGEPADARSDIFSLGCVLYEMLSGQRAFLRDSAVETMAAILREDPPRFAASGVAVGAELARTVERCLEKRPERRFQSASDLAFALRSVVSDSDVPGVVASTATAAAVRPTAGGRRRVWVAVAVLVVVGVVAVAGVIGWRWLGGAKPAAVEAVVPSTRTPSPFITEWLVTVEPFENRTGDPSLDIVARTLGDAIVEALGRVTQGLRGLPAVTVLAAPISGSPVVQPGELPPEGQGRLLVTGSYTVQGSGVEVVAQIRDRDGQRILYASETVSVPRQPSRASVEKLIEQLMGAVGIHAAIGLQRVSHVPDYQSFRDFTSCEERKFTQGPRAPCDELDRALERDPEFLQPAFSRALSPILTGRPEVASSDLEHIRKRSGRLTSFESTYLQVLDAWQRGDPGAALAAARSLQRAAPDYLLAAVFRSVIAAQLNRPAEVIEAADTVVAFTPPTFVAARRGGESLLVEAYLALGEHEKLLALARRIRRETPGTTASFVNEARALAALGRFDDLDALVEECRSTVGGGCDGAWVLVQASWHLAAYGHREQSLAYAGRAVALYEAMPDEKRTERGPAVAYLWALRTAERWDTYGEFAARCVREKPADPEQPWFCSCVGMAAAHRGDRDTAMAILQQLEAEGHYNPAAYVAAYLGEHDRAIELLRRSLAGGEFTYTQIRHWDLDLQPLWDYPPFQELIRPRG